MTIVDTNVLVDILTEDPAWLDWSAEQLDRQAAQGLVIVNEVIYAELSIGLADEAAVEDALVELDVAFHRRPIPALFVAGKAYLRYRAGGCAWDRRACAGHGPADPHARPASLPHLLSGRGGDRACDGNVTSPGMATP
jgi:predicted nucleic acid-binding protein